MKRCPSCNLTFSDPNLSFCIDDGTPLVDVIDGPDESTVVSPPTQKISSGNNQYQPRDWQVPEYQAPGAYGVPPKNEKRKTWPWVIGIIAVVFLALMGLGIAAAIIVPSIVNRSAKRNGSISKTTTATPNANVNSNLNSTTPDNNSNSAASNSNANENAAEENVPAPTDHDAVLARLTDLENEWTVANINADKKQLDKILADDYAGTTADGKALGKAEYLQTIERDTTTQKWDFQDLQLSLKGNRAVLSGVVHFQTSAGETSFNFTDRFVWRDGRWQATGSDISPIK